MLTVNKWFDEKLWPEGYNFFSHVKNSFSSHQSNDKVFSPNEEVLKPAKIILNNSGNHTLYTKSSVQYQSVVTQINEILKLSAIVEAEGSVTGDEWNNLLKSKSCYFSYPVIYDYAFLQSQILNKYTNVSGYCREFLIGFDPRVSSVVYLYSKDAKSESVSKKKINYDCINLKSIIDTTASLGNNYYSFELNFDKQKNDSVDQPIIIDSDVLISITPKDLYEINEINIFKDISTNENLYSQVLSEFGFNTSTIRKYIESDNSIVFVENFATLKLGSNSLLDYKSVENSGGIKIGGNSTYESINSCITFVNNISNVLFSKQEMYYEISSDISDINSKTYTLYFDYYINDNMVVINEDRYSQSHAVVVEVVSGKIVSYKQICNEYTATEKIVNIPSAIDAIDSLYSSHQTGDVITDIFTAYSFDSSINKFAPCWYIEKSDGVISEIPLATGGDGI